MPVKGEPRPAGRKVILGIFLSFSLKAHFTLHITVYFDENKLLSHIRGDVVAGSGVPVIEETETAAQEVLVPEGAIQKKEKGFFDRVLDKVLPEE